MSEQPVISPKETAAKVSSYNAQIQDVTDNDVDEGINLIKLKQDWPPQYVVDYLNKVRRGKIIKALLFALISQIPLIIVLIMR